MTIPHSKTNLLISLILCLFLTACKDVPPIGPAGEGPYSLCSYRDNLEAEGYSSARLSYPCEATSQPLPAVTLSGGYTNFKEQMYWLADHLTKHGYVVITVTPNNMFGGLRYWTDAHRDAYFQLLEENMRPESPVAFRIDTSRIVLSGYSNGGFGAMSVAKELGSAIHSVMGMASYFPLIGGEDFSEVEANTLLMAGTLDTTVFPFTIENTFNDFTSNAQHTFVQFNGVTHFEWIDIGRYHNKFRTLMVSWLDDVMNQDKQWQGYLFGEEHEQHVNDNWYRDYIWKGPVSIPNIATLTFEQR
ncbi:MAG: hypothetical protein MI867_28565 [Pseudomonadales bacterium]|nr:hypothetical protein [Pseudomonadales bacterium]